jgi:hypothetical protein
MPPSGNPSFLQNTSGATGFNQQTFAMAQMLARVQTVTLATVIAVRPGAGGEGRVDVQPIVSQVDGEGNVEPHAKAYDLPYFRYQGGVNAVVMDPEVGDIGIVAFASRDISKAKATREVAAPGSGRRFSMADGLYLGGLLNGEPQQIIAFGPAGISITTPNSLSVTSQNMVLDAAGNLAVTGEVTARLGAESVGLSTHRHPGTNTPPTPGT